MQMGKVKRATGPASNDLPAEGSRVLAGSVFRANQCPFYYISGTRSTRDDFTSDSIIVDSLIGFQGCKEARGYEAAATEIYGASKGPARCVVVDIR